MSPCEPDVIIECPNEPFDLWFYGTTIYAIFNVSDPEGWVCLTDD